MADKDNKDTKNKEEYNSTNKAVEPKKVCCGFVCAPGVQYHSTIVTTICPKCSKVGETKVDTHWNIKSYLCCYYYGACWWCWQTLKGKDYTLKDGKSTCGSCGEVLSDYKSCE